jgi:hypothetical protein
VETSGRLEVWAIAKIKEGGKKMNTVKLYKITRTKTYMMCEQGEGFSLYPWGSNTPSCEGEDDGGKDYILPDGYHIGETKSGEKMIYDANDKYMIIGKTSHGMPMLLGDFNYIPLRLAE